MFDLLTDEVLWPDVLIEAGLLEPQYWEDDRAVSGATQKFFDNLVERAEKLAERIAANATRQHPQG